MKDCLIRIDDRLIHGQILEAWIPHIMAMRIVVIDDDVAYDPFRETVIRMVVPKDIEIRIFSTRQFIEENKDAMNNERTIFLFSNISDAVTLLKGGFVFDKLNLGNLCSSLPTQVFSTSVMVNAQDIEDIRYLLKAGISVELQRTPTDKAICVKSLLEDKV
ncbi:MAG: PTS sugar transporter subunit IIB [Deltaproteobacteria bacterium]